MKVKLMIQMILGLLLILIIAASQNVLFAANAVINVSGSTVIRTFTNDLFGNNAAVWEATLDGTDTVCDNLMSYSGQRLVRYPGGSYADILAWDTMGTTASSTHDWCASNDDIIAFANSFGAKLQAIVNFSGYWDGVQHTQAEAIQKAVNWVTYMNKTRGLGVKYWEIGNEIYGSWEQGYTTGTDYGSRFAEFYKAMKAVDSTIMIGAVSSPYEADYSYWMRDLLTAAKAKGVVPDFLVIHMYQYAPDMSPATDAKILQGVNDIAAFTASLNQIVTNYVGASYVGKIRYFMTEFRSVLDTKPHLLTFLDTMFCSQYIMEMAKYGWDVSNLWNIKNGMDPNGGDYGFIDKTNNNPRATYYMYPFMTGKFGKTLVTSTCSNTLLRSYAAKDDSGALTLFIVNNSPDTDLTTQVNITGFATSSSGEEWVLTPAGNTPSGASTPIQERTDIAVNGVVHPDPASLKTMAGTKITTGLTFSVTIPKSALVFIKIPKNSAADQTAPATPAGVTATTLSNSQIALNWTKNTESDLYGYNVYRSTDPNNAASWTYAAFGLNTNSYTDSGLSGMITYYYKITAVDTSGNESAPAAVQATTLVTPGSLRVQYLIGSTIADDWEIAGQFNVVNAGDTTVPLSEVTFRYWYTNEGNPAQTYACYYAAVDSKNITSKFVNLAPPVTGANNYLELGFTTGAGSLAPGGQTGIISMHLHRNDGTYYNEADDWSFDPTKTTSAEWNHLTIYRNGVLVWGNEPTGLVSGTPTPTGRATPTPTFRVSSTPTMTPTVRATATPSPTARTTVTPTLRSTVTPTPTGRRVTPTPTRRNVVTATPTSTVRATVTPTTRGGYMVSYAIQSDWGNGATINVTITNNTSAAVNGWTLAFSFPGNQTIANLWNGSYTQSGASVSVKDAGSNAVIGANGGAVNFGFNISYSGTNAKPASFTLNGTACGVQ